MSYVQFIGLLQKDSSIQEISYACIYIPYYYNNAPLKRYHIDQMCGQQQPSLLMIVPYKCKKWSNTCIKKIFCFLPQLLHCHCFTQFFRSLYPDMEHLLFLRPLKYSSYNWQDAFSMISKIHPPIPAQTMFDILLTSLCSLPATHWGIYPLGLILFLVPGEALQLRSIWWIC